MTTRENLTAELQAIQLKMRLLTASETITTVFLKKEDFVKNLFGGKMTVELWSSERFFSCGDLTLKSKQITHFLWMTRDFLSEEEVAELNKLKRAIKLIEAHEEESWRILNDVSNEMITASLK